MCGAAMQSAESSIRADGIADVNSLHVAGTAAYGTGNSFLRCQASLDHACVTVYHLGKVDKFWKL